MTDAFLHDHLRGLVLCRRVVQEAAGSSDAWKWFSSEAAMTQMITDDILCPTSQVEKLAVDKLMESGCSYAQWRLRLSNFIIAATPSGSATSSGQTSHAISPTRLLKREGKV